MKEVKIKPLTINFGPQHPAAHGVLRMVLQMDGEIIERVSELRYEEYIKDISLDFCKKQVCADIRYNMTST